MEVQGAHLLQGSLEFTPGSVRMAVFLQPETSGPMPPRRPLVQVPLSRTLRARTLRGCGTAGGAPGRALTPGTLKSGAGRMRGFVARTPWALARGLAGRGAA